MAARKSKSAPKAALKVAPNAALTFTIPVMKPRNLLAMNPLLKKSAAHTSAQSRDKRQRSDALEVQQGVQDALNRRGSSGDKGGNDGGEAT